MVLAGCVEGFLLLAALVCSSFSAVNLGTSKRSVLTPEGDERVLGVRRGNKLTARTGTSNVEALHSGLFKFHPLYKRS